jgi:endoglucanase
MLIDLHSTGRSARSRAVAVWTTTCVAVALSGCGSASGEAEPAKQSTAVVVVGTTSASPAASPTPTPAATPVATPTPVPTATPEPDPTLTLTLTPTPAAASSSASPAAQHNLRIGINMPGYEGWGDDMRYGYKYILPSIGEIKALVAKGLVDIRLPINWGRFQNAQGGALDTTEVARLKDWLAQANAAGARVQIEVHGYGQTGWGTTLAQSPGALADFSARMVAQFGDLIAGYGLMNEPAKVSGEVWYREAQLALTSVGKIAPNEPVYVCGAGWCGPGSWPQVQPLNDPNGQAIYEAHAYPDPDNSGTFSDSTNVVPLSSRLQPFVAWLAQNKVRGSVGEYGTLGDSTHVDALEAGLNYLASAPNIESFYYWCGNGWGDTRMAALLDGVTKPQMSPLVKRR